VRLGCVIGAAGSKNEGILMKTMLAAIIALSFVSQASIRADDWPQFRGPHRDGVSRETGLRKEWPKDGPPLLWTSDRLGLGYSGPAIVGDRLFISCGRGDSEYLVAFDLKDAANGPKELWATRIGPMFQWKGNSWNRGPNASPTVAGDTVYALGGFGDLICCEASSGKEHWRKNLPRDLGGEVNPIGGGLEDPTPLGWGYASSPLVDDDRLICVPGGKRGLLAALNKDTGALIWQSRDLLEQACYSSPLPIEFGGIKQYVQVTNPGIFGVAANDGKLLWSYRRNPPYEDGVIGMPVFHDGSVFQSVGFGQGCDLIKLEPKDGSIAVQKIYSNKTVDNRDGGVVRVGEYLFGHSDNPNGWFCQEFKTGKFIWTENRKFGRGSVTCADGQLYCCAEKDGIVVLIDAAPNGWTEHGRLKLPRQSDQRLPSGCLWTHPVVANKRLYIRDQELLFCYDLAP
jgi:outer membrane protein assembly factor BamB